MCDRTESTMNLKWPFVELEVPNCLLETDRLGWILGPCSIEGLYNECVCVCECDLVTKFSVISKITEFKKCYKNKQG